eukprot:TRINITY_DN856_c0_g1_i1.p1 TRINITY_DN856_c0_g1~~TRINITY_DN856_c0_g1_i1.p1  ORF type:complete len:307 (-),score=64.23 TRINITY_DN856_c0_g1_i1:90-1010(-)
MTLLSNLGLPCLTPKILRLFQEADILTVEDLLFSGKVKKISSAFKDGILNTIIKNLEHLYTPPLWNAEDMFEKLAYEGICLSTGSEKFDQFIGGGLYSGDILELAGDASSGKSQLCMLISMIAASRTYSTVALIDTNGAFYPKRMLEMYNNSGESTEDISFFNKINIYNAHDPQKLINTLTELEYKLEDDDDEFASNLNLIVIDTIGNILAPSLGRPQTLGHSNMVDISYRLKTIAEKYNITVVITNHVVKNPVKPALGQYWRSIPNTTVLLLKCGDITNCSILSSSRTGPAEISFKIVDSGITVL